VGFPLHDRTHRVRIGKADQPSTISWWQEKDGVRFCHVWSFSLTVDGHTSVYATQVLRGFSIGLSKPVIARPWQDGTEAMLYGFQQEANLLNRFPGTY
jgi:hypothetical protein